MEMLTDYNLTRGILVGRGGGCWVWKNGLSPIAKIDHFSKPAEFPVSYIIHVMRVISYYLVLLRPYHQRMVIPSYVIGPK